MNEPRPLWSAWVRFWSTDRSLSALLLLLLVVTFMLPPLTASDARRSLTADGVFSLLLLAGIGSAWSEGRRVFGIVALLTAGALAGRWWVRFTSGGEAVAWNAASDVIVLAAFALVVLAKVVRPGTVTSQRIQGAVAVYLLFGLVWANAYEWTELTHPGAFHGATGTGIGPWIYYSFVTLTTMGYGDIIPVHPIARSLAAAEALTGQLYIAILISRLVALEIAERRSNHP
jgi:hypothetical protein